MSNAWRRKLIEGIDFNNKEFYSELGFKSGLEIHQQLNTKKKLFCHCPVGYRNDEPDAIILRHMRPTLSEMGTYDGTALMEFKTKKQVIYQLYRDNVCTYEMDDTPPFPINQEALDYAIEIALMLNCQLVDEVHITRKQYLDGSIPTGFQRTAIIGVNGWVPYKNRKIQIQQLALEEDSCREVQDKGHEIIFRTDRLSTPLIEIVTKPEMFTPHETAEVGELLGRLLRASGRVRRGIGSVRQDVNVSIKGCDRIEIKGVPRTPDIRPLTHYEALRQKSLLDLKHQLNQRGITKDTIETSCHDLTNLFADKDDCKRCGIPSKAEKILAVNLSGWQNLLKHKTQPGLNFANELAGRVRVIACLDETPNIYVLDNQAEGKLHGEIGIPIEKEEHIRKAIGARENDTLVLLWGSAEDVETGAKEIIIRAKEACELVPQETRQHMPDKCRTDFERLLPGPDRMYPDTDSPPVALTKERVERIRAAMALHPWEREKRYKELGIPDDLSKQLAIHPQARLFDKLINEFPLSSKLLAVAIVEYQKAIKRSASATEIILEEKDNKAFEDFFRQMLKIQAPQRAFYYSFEKFLFGNNYDTPSVLADDELSALCKKIVTECKDIRYKTRNLTLDFLLGEVLQHSQGRANAQTARRILNTLLA